MDDPEYFTICTQYSYWKSNVNDSSSFILVPAVQKKGASTKLVELTLILWSLNILQSGRFEPLKKTIFLSDTHFVLDTTAFYLHFYHTTL